MSVRERILALRLLEMQETNSEYTDQIGVHVTVTRKEHDDSQTQEEI